VGPANFSTGRTDVLGRLGRLATAEQDDTTIGKTMIPSTKTNDSVHPENVSNHGDPLS
jgi:hypothetical protein